MRARRRAHIRLRGGGVVSARITKNDLIRTLARVERERDAYHQLWQNPKPDYSLEVFLPGNSEYSEPDRRQIWHLHASHRASGPVLRIQHMDDDGAEQVLFLCCNSTDFRDAVQACPYRRNALIKCDAWYAEQVRRSA